MGFLSCKIATSQTLSSVTKSPSSKRFRWGFVHFSLSDCAEIGTRAKETEEGGGEGREFPLSSLPSNGNVCYAGYVANNSWYWDSRLFFFFLRGVGERLTTCHTTKALDSLRSQRSSLWHLWFIKHYFHIPGITVTIKQIFPNESFQRIQHPSWHQMHAQFPYSF